MRLFGEQTVHAIWAQEIEKEIVRCYGEALARFRSQERAQLLFAGLCLTGNEEKCFHINEVSPDSDSIRRNVFISPEILVDINEPEETPFAKTLLPLIDTMWQMAGDEGTPFRDKAGSWTPFLDHVSK